MRGSRIALASAIGSMLLVPAAPLADEPPAPPTAALEAASTTVAAGTSIKLDSSGSRAGTGAIVGHVWDLDGNGSFETDSGAKASVDVTPEQPGPLTVHVRVVDDRGLSSDAQLDLTVAAAPKMVAADKTIAKSAEVAPAAPAAGHRHAPESGPAASTPLAGNQPSAPADPAAPSATPPPAPSATPPTAPSDPAATQPTAADVRMSAAPALVPRKLLASGETYGAVAKAATSTTVTAAAASTGVTIKNFKFAPASSSVHVGDTITWTNQDAIGHTATATDGSFNTGTINQGKSGSHTFTKAGTFAYICSIHPSMHGTVVVAAATTSSGGTGSGSTGNSGGTTPTHSSSSSSLPQTGLDIAVVVLLAALMMAAGTALRRTAN
jgi:plastocyanin